jgi:hypothetical protein
MRNTNIGSEVNVVIDGKTQKGKIVQVITEGAARIELGPEKYALATYSLSGENGTFSYPDEKIVAKPQPAPAAAGPPSVSK